MPKFLFIYICLFSSIISISSQEVVVEQLTESESDLEIEFDDFPDNSNPDIESLFDEFSDDYELKELGDFIQRQNPADTIEQQSELGLDFHGFPSSIVNGCVNVMSGEYQETATDFTLPGAMPLNMQRYYCGGKSERHSFLYGWQLSHGAKLLCYKTKYRHDCAILKGSDRHGALYRGRYHDKCLSCPDSFFKKGVTNCSLGEICAKTNFKNDLLFKDHGVLSLQTADHTNYLFTESPHDLEKENRKTHAYRLDKLELPDGNSYQYKYSKSFGMPTAISQYNRKGVKTCGLKLKNKPTNFVFQKNPSLTYVTSTKEQITYRFHLYGNPKKKRAILSEVHSPHSPTINYAYETVRDHYNRKRLIKRSLPNHRFMKIAYDEDDKVKKLISPAGKGGQEVATHTFTYFKDGDTHSAEVKNALGGVKKYYWNKKSNRLNGIATIDKKGNRIFRERYRWGNNSEDESHLTARIFEEGDGSLIAYQEYQYDAYGNISKSLLYGNLTGECKRPASIGKSLLPPSKELSEVYKTHWKYDSHKRRVYESDTRISNRFAYYEDTDLLSAQYTSYDGSIKTRHFYSYDDTGAVTEEISDDGSSKEINDLSDVTERLIKNTQNNVRGLPEVIEEYALDLSSGQNILIRKTVNQYDLHGWMIAQSIYGSDAHLAYTLEWAYDSHGNVISEKDALGQLTTSEYDTNDNLIFEQKPDAAARYFTYDYMNRLIQEEQRASNGESLHKQYSYDSLGNCVSTIDIYGNATLSKYDSHCRLVKINYPTNDKSQLSPTIKQKYDGLGRANSITNANGQTTSIKYNLRGKPTCTTYPDGTSERHTFTIWGDVAKSSARDGTFIQFTYDPQGREIEKRWFDADGSLLKTTSKEYNALHLLSETDGNGVKVNYSYDYAGKLISESVQDRITNYAYDALGQRTTATQVLEDGSSVSNVEIHDAMDRVIESYIINSNGEISKRVLINYDAQGHEILRQEWNQAGRAVTTSNYDQFGRVTCVINPLGESVHTVYYIDKAPRQEVTDPLGIKNITTYDPFGHPVAEQRYDLMGQLVEQTEYAYDLTGNKILRRIITTDQPVETVWEYDSLNQVLKTTEAAGTPEQRNVQRRYDNAGRLITLIKNDGSSLNYTYDGLGRRISLKSSDGTLSYSYSYDKNDNMLSAKDEISHTAISRTYNDFNELVNDTLPYTHTFKYAYDLLGNIGEVTLPDQSKICYDRLGHKLLSVIRKSALSYKHTYTSYDESLNPTSVLLAADAGSLRVDYDLLARPLNIQCSHWQETLDYDSHQLKERKIIDAFGETVSSYSYDAKDQLISENGTAEHSFEYDWQGNPISYDGNLRKFNACNALLDDSKHQYTYDINGNRISDGVHIYRYDALDRLVEAKTPKGTYQYIYDALGRRVARIHDDETTYFLWQEQQEIGAISSSGIIQELKILNPSDHAIAFELKGALYIPLHDIFGHVRALLDSSGNCVATYRYSAFGEEQIQGEILSPWRYAGKRVDVETGFIYFGERYYDPATLCWLNPDPMEDADGPNLYAYVHNNPLFYVDPDGCFSMEWITSNWTTIVAVAAEAALIATGVGMGFAGVAEGFMAGCSGGITGTAIDLALDAAHCTAKEAWPRPAPGLKQAP